MASPVASTSTGRGLWSAALSTPAQLRTPRALFAPAAAQVRHSHVGSAPLYVPPGTSLTILPTPPRPNPTRPVPDALKKAQTIVVEGPLGKCIVPLHECVRLRWESGAQEQTKGKGKAASAAQTEQPSAASPVKSGKENASGEPQKLTVSVLDPQQKTQRSKWGLTRALLNNALEGVQEGHSLILRFVGVGYRGAVEDEPFAAEVDLGDGNMGKPKRLNLRLGYSHPVVIPIPQGITATMPQPTRIVLKGTDKEKIGLFASQIRAWRKPEPYKGKGIFVGEETIKLRTAKKK
ncbi:ribosomal protein L6 [Tilletiaria anomala UBC 951]|uniref:Ribosomal protein L6 n=1 Tax=Tilletiaria anomala (strain ATCC 24038 / CBS 436.72 / UBC 951) TaxID=1037660 RepID=A0A066VS08_TILAU|nr:ribosomal protein L6 [Tilletiaria anomala UBC 951]KDN44266.1 ribosomal protein L6 [Tilletiaria anomala UBC 951]